MKNSTKKMFVALSLFCIGFTIKTMFHLSTTAMTFYTIGFLILAAVACFAYIIYRFRTDKWLM